MPLPKNSQAPDFSLPSTTGKIFTLSKDLQGKVGVIYFYPKDFTPGCTKEACEFRDSFEFFRDLDTTIIGISRDTIETHLQFKETFRLPFELLSDVEGKVANLYKASVPLIKFTRRITYLLDKNQSIVAAYENMFDARKHIQKMIGELDKK